MRPKILTELSALGLDKNISPMLPKLIGEVKRLREGRLGHPDLIVDSGCGQLRHLDTLLSNFSKLCLVDTEFQLDRRHLLRGEKQTIRHFVQRTYPHRHIRILS